MSEQAEATLVSATGTVPAAVRLRAGGTLTPDELRSFTASLLAPYKVPSTVWFVDEPLPRSPSGKLLKRELQARSVSGAV